MVHIQKYIAWATLILVSACQPSIENKSKPSATPVKHTWEANPRNDIYGQKIDPNYFQGKVNIVFVSNVADRMKGAAMAEHVLTQFAKHKKLNAFFILDGRTLSWYIKGVISSIGSTVEEQIQITAKDAYNRAMRIPNANRWYQSEEEIRASLHFVVDANGGLIDASGLIPKEISASLVDAITGKQLMINNRAVVMKLVDFEKRNANYQDFIKNLNNILLGSEAEIVER